MALAVIAVLFIPVIQLFNHAIYATSDSKDIVSATHLARSEMEKIVNLNFTKTKLREMGDDIYPPLDKEPLVINQTRWRVKREVIQKSDPLEVRIRVYRDGDMKKEVVTLVTLVEDMMWELVKPVSGE